MAIPWWGSLSSLKVCKQQHFVAFSFIYLASGKNLPTYASICFTAGFSSSFLGNRPTCDQTANRRRIKSILVLRTYVWHE